MDKIYEQTMLFDFYGELLTEHQRSVYIDVVYNDLSLGEIAEERGISRQGVHDLIRRCDKILRDYEGKLHLVERFAKAKETVREIQTLAEIVEEQETAEEPGTGATPETAEGPETAGKAGTGAMPEAAERPETAGKAGTGATPETAEGPETAGKAGTGAMPEAAERPETDEEQDLRHRLRCIGELSRKLLEEL